MTRRFADFSRPSRPPWRWTDTFLVGLCSAIAVAAFTAIFILFLMIHPAGAKWKPEYANSPQHVRDWYETRELTEAARKRFHFKSCCAHSDVVKTKFRVGAADEWWWLDGETWRRIPDDIIHWDQHSPKGEAVLFAVGGHPVCFFPPESGN